MDDEDVFKIEVTDAAIESASVNYQSDYFRAEDNSWVIVELFTGDRFKVSIEQVRED